jgi:CubicO group peptidase (beta-lactamase class C family)
MTSKASRVLAAFAAACAVGVLTTGCGAAATTAPAPDVPAPRTAELTAADVGTWLDGLVPAALERSGIPGAAVAVVHDGQVLTARGYGWADTGSDGGEPRPVDPDRTLFRVGSISKVFVATAVMQLVEQGRIDLDADVERYLDFPLPRAFAQPVTMRHLLTHTAGFEERIKGLIALDGPGPDLRETVAVDPPEQVFAPGTVPAYSNYGYALAGYVVERVSGVPFDAYVEQNVIRRAGMTSSTFAQPLPAELADRLARGYASSSSPPEPFEVVGTAPAGALSATATDMARFMLAQLGELGPEHDLLSPDTRATMWRPGLDAAALGTLAAGPRMALGLFDESRGGLRILGHGGDTNYFHSHLQLFPDERTGVFVTLNGTGTTAVETLTLRRSLLEGFADRYFPSTAPEPPTAPTAAGHAAMAEGSYESARAPFSTFLRTLGLLGQTTVAARPDGTVLISPAPGDLDPAVYREVEPWVWQEVGGERRIAMRPDGDRVGAIGFESAFTLLRAQPDRDARIVLPVLIGSAAVLLLALLAWPIGAIVRRRYRVPPPPPVNRLARTPTRVAVAAAVFALAGWAAVVVTIAGLQDVPVALLRALQAAQWVALLGLVPAAALLVGTIRHRAGALRVIGSVCVLLALAGTAWFAQAYGLLAPDVSY